MQVAILWFIDENNEILLSQRAIDMDTDPGLWGPSVSGKIEPGESAADTARRESEEELGVATSMLEHVEHLCDGTHMPQLGEKREFQMFVTRVSRDIEKHFQLNPREVAAVRWSSLHNLRTEYSSKPETILISRDTKLWKTIFEKLEASLA